MLTPAPAGVSLAQLLAAKDNRARRQHAWLTRYRQPLIALSLVTPGPLKQSDRYRRLLAEGCQACQHLLQQQGSPVLAHQVFHSEAGSTALWSVAHPAQALKQLCVGLEQQHPLGRLWDFDLFCPDNGPLGRSELGASGRRCLLCNQLAHACARSRAHPLAALLASVDTLIDDYFA